MFNLGLPEIVVIAGVALLVFGPKRLPELARSLGKGVRDFKKALEGHDRETSDEGKNSAPSRLGPSDGVTDSHSP